MSRREALRAAPWAKERSRPQRNERVVPGRHAGANSQVVPMLPVPVPANEKLSGQDRRTPGAVVRVPRIRRMLSTGGASKVTLECEAQSSVDNFGRRGAAKARDRWSRGLVRSFPEPRKVPIYVERGPLIAVSSAPKESRGSARRQRRVRTSFSDDSVNRVSFLREWRPSAKA